MNEKIPKTILVTSGRAPVALELSRMLGRSGARIIVAESSGGFLCRSSRFVDASYRVPSPGYRTIEYIDALLEIIRKESVDLLIPTCEEVLFISRFKDQLAANCQVFVPQFKIIETLHRKDCFAELAGSLNLTVPQTLLLGAEGGELDNFPADVDQFVLKPVYSRFGCSARVIRRDEFEATKALVFDGNREWLVQKYLSGSEYHAYAVVSDGCVLASVVYRSSIGKRSMGPCLAFEAVAKPEIDEWVRHFVRELGFTGQIAFDFIVGEDDVPCAIECNPRATSGLHLLADVDEMYKAFVFREQVSCNPGRLRNKGLLLPSLLQGKPGFFKDVIFRWDDPLPSFAQILILMSFAAKAFLRRMKLEEAIVADLSWNGESGKVELIAASELDGKSAPYLKRLGTIGAQEFVANVSAEVQAIRGQGFCLPVVIPDVKKRNCYVCSFRSHFGDYARYEIGVRKLGVLGTGLKLCLFALKGIMKVARSEESLFVNNWLLSTNLYPSGVGGSVVAIRDRVLEAEPKRAVVFRSLNRRCNPGLIDSLRKSGFRPICSREVYILDIRSGEHRLRSDFCDDLKLFEKSGFEIIKGENFREEDFDHSIYLYRKLYLEKYTDLNPQFSSEMLHQGVQSGFLKLLGLKSQGKLIGVLGYYRCEDWITAPILGYETGFPKSMGLYRMLTLLLTLEGERLGCNINRSSGAAHFKISRGAQREVEYSYVYYDHLPWQRRWAWRAFSFVVNRVAEFSLRYIDF